MAKVLGIGGIFFKAADPKAVREWYARVLGFDVTEWGGVSFDQAAGNTQAWSVFAADSDYMAPSSQPFMINLAVDDLEGVLANCRKHGVEATTVPDESMGKFAHIMDPEGNKIELWEPKPMA